jgi:hypothetical protein
MSLTITEARAVNTVLDHLADTATVLTRDERTAAARLAEAAHRRLAAGWSADRVRAHWPAPHTTAGSTR